MSLRNSVFLLLKNRKEVIKEAAELTRNTREELLGMGRQIAWINTETSIGSECTKASERGVQMKLLAARNEGEVKRYARAFERIGAQVRYYEHGDIRVIISDRREALVAIPSNPTVVNTGPREYVGLLTREKEMVNQLADRFDNFWTVARKEGEAVLKDRIAYFLLDHKGKITAGAVSFFLGLLLNLATYIF